MQAMTKATLAMPIDLMMNLPRKSRRTASLSSAGRW